MMVKRRIKVILIALSLVFLVNLTAEAQETMVRGIVFEDTNRNLQLDLGEKGIEGVCVSNGREVTQTDQEGRYSLPAYQEMVVFITKPSDYDLPVNEQNVPQFYYIHRPAGSPPNISEYPGIEATGGLPDSLNFPLFTSRRNDNFKMVVLGDTQVTNHREISYLRDEIVEEIKGTDALFAISMGDNVNDTLNLYPRYLDIMKEMEIPVFYVPGNHDSNYDSLDEEHQYETYTRYLSAPYYSFNYGKVHFVVLDDVMWDGKEYHGELGEKQLIWLKNDLSFVPSDYLVVLNMHIPLVSYIDRTAEKHQMKDREQLFEILQEREVLALAGHTHTIERFFPSDVIDGWQPDIPIPQIIVGAACGSWWSGPEDERGIPFSYQRDAAPNGYFIFQFQGNQWQDQFKVSERAMSDQMNISFLSRNLNSFTPLEGIFTQEETEGIKVVANIFNGDSQSTITCQIDDSIPSPMKRTSTKDPYMNRFLYALEDWLYPQGSTHTWVAPLPSNLEPGIHTLTVSFTDRYGNTYQATRLFEIW